MKYAWHALLCAALLSLFVAGSALAAPLSVVVSIVPQKAMVKAIGGDLVTVAAMVQPGASPATYEPTPMQMATLNRASLYLSAGVPFEAAWMDRIRSANPDMTVVATDTNIPKLPIAHHHHEHEDEHGKEDDHHNDHDTQEILDPHIWLSPDLYASMARTTAGALMQADPAHSNKYERNLRKLLMHIDELDTELANMLTPIKGKGFMVFHPSWGYFAHRYHLVQTAIEVEGKEPSPRELAELVTHARETGVFTIFIQPQFSKRTASIIANEIGAQVEVLDPLAEDWADNLRKAARVLVDNAR